MKVIFIATSITLCSFGLVQGQKHVELKSPSGNLTVTIEIKDTLRYSIPAGANVVLSSSLSMQLGNGQWLGIKAKLNKNQFRAVRDSIVNPIPHKRYYVPDKYNEVVLQFKENFSVVFRAFNDGVAYRFQLQMKDSVIIKNEQAGFQFPNNSVVYFPEVKKLMMPIFSTLVLKSPIPF